MTPTLCPRCGVHVTPTADGPDLLCPRCSLVLPAAPSTPAKRIGRPPAAEPRTPRGFRATDAEWLAIQEVGQADVRAWAVAEAARRRRRAESARQAQNAGGALPT